MNRLLLQIARTTEKLIKQRERDAEKDEEEPDLLPQEQVSSSDISDVLINSRGAD